MKQTPSFRSIIAAAALLSAMTAHAQLNGPPKAPDRVAARAVGSLTVTGTQTVAAQGNCSRVTIFIRGSVTGVDNDDGAGNDTITFDLWDDGDLKDTKTISVPVGQTLPVNVTLGFLGLYGTGAAGVGVLDSDGLTDIDPFLPTDVPGSCASTATAIPVLGAPALAGTIGLIGLAGALRIRRRKTS